MLPHTNPMPQKIIVARDRAWGWFVARAEGPHALFWLVVCAVLDPIFFPIAPEIYLAALILAKPHAWRRYLPVAIIASTVGAALGYLVGLLLFNYFGAAVIGFYGLEAPFARAQAQVGQNVLTAMLLVPFTLIPEKVFVLAAGFLGAPFLPYLTGFVIGRSVRIALITYLFYRFGEKVLEMIGRYFFAFTIIILALLAYYGIVHLQLLPL